MHSTYTYSPKKNGTNSIETDTQLYGFSLSVLVKM